MDAKEIVKEARQQFAQNHDKKQWVRREEMDCLIAAGARIIIKNGKTEGRIYVTEAIFEGIHFITAGPEPLIQVFQDNDQNRRYQIH